MTISTFPHLASSFLNSSCCSFTGNQSKSAREGGRGVAQQRCFSAARLPPTSVVSRLSQSGEAGCCRRVFPHSWPRWRMSLRGFPDWGCSALRCCAPHVTVFQRLYCGTGAWTPSRSSSDAALCARGLTDEPRGCCPSWSCSPPSGSLTCAIRRSVCRSYWGWAVQLSRSHPF